MPGYGKGKMSHKGGSMVSPRKKMAMAGTAKGAKKKGTRKSYRKKM